MSAAPVPAWNGRDLGELLGLERVDERTFRSHLGDANIQGRAYGGQVLGQALMAAAQTVPEERACTAMQSLFLQGTIWDEAVRFEVTALQDGKRFSSRHVRAVQAAGRLVLDAQVSFASPAESPQHEAALPSTARDPDALPPARDLPVAWQQALRRATGYAIVDKPAIDFRIEDPPQALRLAPAEPRLCFWVRVREPLPQRPSLHAAAFAYLSDWWINYPATGAHLVEAEAAGGLYVASLNHAIWLHRPLRADQWLRFDSLSPAAGSGRGLCVARVHDHAGRLVASVTQECLMVPRGK